MEEVERLADHIVIIDHGQVLADDSPAALHKRLKARAMLRVELAEPAGAPVLDALRTHAGVTALAIDGAALDIGLLDNDDAMPVLDWLRQNGKQPLHFATARTSLEDIFLNLTGRSLRD